MSSIARTVALTLFLLVSCNDSVAASPWGYQLSLGDGFVFHSGGGYSCIEDTVHHWSWCTDDNPGIGKECRLVITADEILVQTYSSDWIKKEFYFVIEKATREVTGPLKFEEFKTHPAVVRAGSLSWWRPWNYPLAIGIVIFFVCPMMAFGWFLFRRLGRYLVLRERRLKAQGGHP